MKLHTRGGLAAIAIAGAALIAAGCGGSGGGSGASDAAKDAAALDLVPKNAIGYVTIDTDFSGDQWTQFSDLAKAFDKDFKGVDEEIAEETSSSDDADSPEGEEKSGDDVDFKKDVEPWLGESGGAALLRVTKGGDDAEWFAWVELEDVDKFEDFAKDQDGTKQGKEVGDYKTFDDADDEMFIAYTDDYAVFTDTRAKLEKVVEFDGDSIKDAEGVSDSIDEVEGDALATVFVNG